MVKKTFRAAFDCVQFSKNKMLIISRNFNSFFCGSLKIYSTQPISEPGGWTVAKSRNRLVNPSFEMTIKQLFCSFFSYNRKWRLNISDNVKRLTVKIVMKCLMDQIWPNSSSWLILYLSSTVMRKSEATATVWQPSVVLCFNALPGSFRSVTIFRFLIFQLKCFFFSRVNNFFLS